MLTEKIEQQTLALAAVFQCAVLVYQLSTFGECDSSTFEVHINSLCLLNAANFQAVFGKKSNLKLGLEMLVDLLNKNSRTHQQKLVSYYAFSLLSLERKLMKEPNSIQYIQRRIKHVELQKHYFNGINEIVVENLADIYLHSISKFRHRIQIVGKQDYIKNQKIFNQIRALLLAGVRAAVLWQQLGGRRYHLFFGRSRILKQCKTLLIHLD